MYNRLDSIQACDGRTDRQTSFHGIIRAMHTRRAVIRPIFIYTFFLLSAIQVRLVDGFYRLYLKRREITQGCAFLGL